MNATLYIYQSSTGDTIYRSSKTALQNYRLIGESNDGAVTLYAGWQLAIDGKYYQMPYAITAK
jgi:hypothetical protein